MKKELIAIIKKANVLIKKDSVDIVKYARVENGTLYITNLDEISIISNNCGLDDGIYMVSDLAIGKKLKKNNLDLTIRDLPNINSEVKDILFTTETKNDFKEFLTYMSKDAGVLNGLYIDNNGNKIATNSFIAKYDTDLVDRENSIVLNNLAVTILSVVKDDVVTLTTNKDIASITIGDTTLICKNLTNTFPIISHVIPKDLEFKTIFNKTDIEILKTLTKFKYIKIYFINGEVFASDSSGEDVVEVKSNLTLFDVEIGFDLKMLSQLVEVDSTLEYKNGKLPLVVDSCKLLMPYRTVNLDINNCDELTI